MSSDRRMNVLRLDFVRDPDLAVRTCLGKEAGEAAAAIRDDPELRRALHAQRADLPPAGVPADGGDDGDDDSDPARGRGA